MISKQEFVNIINELKKVNDFVNEVNEKARNLKCDLNSDFDFFNSNSLFISHEHIVVKLLENMFNDGDTLSWWLYDLDYGRKYEDGCITEEDNTIIDISTAEKLYDYLVKESKYETGR